MQVDVVVIESDNVANAIAEEVSKSAISNLVIGAPSRGLFTRCLSNFSSCCFSPRTYMVAFICLYHFHTVFMNM